MLAQSDSLIKDYAIPIAAVVVPFIVGIAVILVRMYFDVRGHGREIADIKEQHLQDMSELRQLVTIARGETNSHLTSIFVSLSELKVGLARVEERLIAHESVRRNDSHLN